MTKRTKPTRAWLSKMADIEDSSGSVSVGVGVGWKSSTLRCFDDPDHCKVCAFIAGDRSEAVLMEVIRVLDVTLADRERHCRSLYESIRRQRTEANDE